MNENDSDKLLNNVVYKPLNPDRDIKPGKMAIGNDPLTASKIYLFDYGLRRRHLDDNVRVIAIFGRTGPDRYIPIFASYWERRRAAKRTKRRYYTYEWHSTTAATTAIWSFQE